MNYSTKEELLFGCMTYKEIMRLRAAYNLGIRTFETSQANSLYARLVRKGWAKRMKERAKNVTSRDKEQSQ